MWIMSDLLLGKYFDQKTNVQSCALLIKLNIDWSFPDLIHL